MRFQWGGSSESIRQEQPPMARASYRSAEQRQARFHLQPDGGMGCVYKEGHQVEGCRVGAKARLVLLDVENHDGISVVDVVSPILKDKLCHSLHIIQTTICLACVSLLG
eukprot:scaffold8175_cov43-Prasinocladus_malaysianus.AAC.1